MGCGGHRGLFRAFDYYEHSRRYSTCNPDSHNHYRQDDTDEKLMVLKKMYAEGLIDDNEYSIYKQRIYNMTITFDELVNIRIKRMNSENRETDETVNNINQQKNKYKYKIDKLKESKEKIQNVQKKLSLRLEELKKEKERVEALAETVVKSSEDTAEEYIRIKLNIEENIQSLEKRKDELQKELDEIDNMIKTLETKELELEALKLKDEILNIKMDLNK
ncbi:hypothetical protein TR13x_06015 [Caloranaerobacter sp. TR13]|uniref:hypothetical protein n=1 Tax=Caloranaerobacter sp. TR13 TaxID=1302151 RepID=UPI0006D3EE0A|nr:hypothetical protein [Caloranaerobacter sp. TR13]KPU27297.1 hypothetical protein TR13x_06015 [Caloranaerobacter sp. TR13]